MHSCLVNGEVYKVLPDAWLVRWLGWRLLLGVHAIVTHQVAMRNDFACYRYISDGLYSTMLCMKVSVFSTFINLARVFTTSLAPHTTLSQPCTPRPPALSAQ